MSMEYGEKICSEPVWQSAGRGLMDFQRFKFNPEKML